jgi:hypothetical protein
MSETSSEISSDRSIEAKERVRTIGRLFVRFASGRADTRQAIEVYLQDTADIPQVWLISALDSFKDDFDRQFVPTVSEIRTRVAQGFMAEVREIRGIAPGAKTTAALDVTRVLERIKVEAPDGPEQLRELEGDRRARMIGGS